MSVQYVLVTVSVHLFVNALLELSMPVMKNVHLVAHNVKHALMKILVSNAKVSDTDHQSANAQ